MRKFRRRMLITLLCLNSGNSFAETITAVCHEPDGFVVSYYSKFTLKEYYSFWKRIWDPFLNTEENRFNENRETLKNSTSTLTWNSKEEKAILISQSPDMGDGYPRNIYKTSLTPTLVSKEQYTFVATENKYTTMFTLYPKEQIAIESYHTYMKEPTINGMISHLLHMKCNIKIEPK